MATEKLWQVEGAPLRFEARVVSVGALQGATSIVLDRTAFYPEGGGQLGDRGRLRVGDRDVEVVDVQLDEAGEVHHLLSAPADLPGSLQGLLAVGEVDAARRRDHMSQHTGQHMLSRALLDVARAETVSSRLGSDRSTVDVDAPKLDESTVARAEELTNDVVLEDRPVRVLFPTEAELRALPLRRPPKVDRDVRIVEVEGFDLSPCGGTHCSRTGQVGPVRVVGLERYKGGTRVTFLAGKRALADSREKDRVLAELAEAFTCGPGDVPAAVARLRADLKARTEAFAAARGELVGYLAERLLAEHPVDPSGTTRIVVTREGDDVGALRTLSSALARRPDVVALVAGRERPGADWLVVAERGDSANFDAGAWLKAIAASHGGRGGGRPQRAEGRFPATVDWTVAARS